MSKLLRLSTIRDHRPFIVHAIHVVSVREQPYIENDDTWSMGSSLMTISGTQFTVAESCDVVTQLWQEALGG